MSSPGFGTRQASELRHGKSGVAAPMRCRVAFSGGKTQCSGRIVSCESSHVTPRRGHEVHFASSGYGWYWFAPHRSHFALSFAANSPFAHTVQFADPTGAIEPRGQSAHAKEPLAVGALCLPASHAPQKSAYSSRTLPSVHVWHAVALVTKKVTVLSAHGVHSACPGAAA